MAAAHGHLRQRGSKSSVSSGPDGQVPGIEPLFLMVIGILPVLPLDPAPPALAGIRLRVASQCHPMPNLRKEPQAADPDSKRLLQ